MRTTGICTIVFTLSCFCFEIYTCVLRDGEEEIRTLICTLLELEIVKVEKHVDSGPVVVLVLKIQIVSRIHKLVSV